MKTLAFAVVAVALIAAPAFAQSQPALNPAERTFKVGEHVQAAYVTNRYAVKDPEALGLPKPGFDHRWILVENNAYLISTVSDTVEAAQPVKPAK